MMNLLTRDELIALVTEIKERVLYCSDEELDELLARLEAGVIDPEVDNYIFHANMTAEEIADKALAYCAIAL